MKKLTPVQISEMVAFAEGVFDGTKSTIAFFEKWPDIAKNEEPDVRELWFSMSYYESDKDTLPESAKFYRDAAMKHVHRLSSLIPK